MELLERIDSLTVLVNLASGATGDGGKIALVSGEAGVGKTSLVKHFTTIKANTQVLWGACDALFTPSPLGPLYDIAPQVDQGLTEMIGDMQRRGYIFSTLLNHISDRSSFKLIVFEDIHWADEATMDLIKFLGRRIHKTNALFILTYRDEEVSHHHPLRSILGGLPTADVTRIRLYPLSKSAVDSLQRKAGVEILELYEKTGGNPFYVTEMLTFQDQEIPPSIAEAVVSRISELPEDTRNLLHFISVIPNRVSLGTLKSLYKDCEDSLDICLSKTVLVADQMHVAFRHELARLAVLNSISPMKRIKLHQVMLKFLLKSQDAPQLLAQIVHHAGEAGDADAILRYAPRAANQAAALNSHREAAAYYGIALQYADDIPLEEKLLLLEGRYRECFATAQLDQALEACHQIHDLIKDSDRTELLGENYRKLARLHNMLGEYQKPLEYIEKSIRMLENLPAGSELAKAFSTCSQVYLANEQPHQSLEWGKKALELAKSLNERQIEIHAMINIGIGKMYTFAPDSEDFLTGSLSLALENNFDQEASRAYLNLGLGKLYRRQYGEAESYFSEGLNHCREKDLDTHRLNNLGGLSKIFMDQGRWDEATEVATYVINHETANLLDGRIAFAVIGVIRARRSDPEALVNFEKALPSPDVKGECAFIAKMAKAETYWLNRNLDQVVDEIEANNLHLIETGNPWIIGELSFWRWKANRLPQVSQNMARPYYLQITGNWEEAAAEWKKLNCPYQQALALADGDEDAKRKALVLLASLGATGTVNLLKLKMRESGMKKIPRGPRNSTLSNPEGLTTRQSEILKLLPLGLTNSEIADKLFISPKTVDHHISAILSKLNMKSRVEAVAFVLSDGKTSS